MNKLLKSFFAASALLTLAPATAPALPPQCAEICDYSPCNQLCAQGTLVTRCSDWGICGGARHEDVDTTASMSEDVSQEAEASSRVTSSALVSTAALSVASSEAGVCTEENQGGQKTALTSIYCGAIRDQYLCTIKGCTWDDESSRCY